MFRLQTAAIFRGLQYSKVYTALLCDLSIVNGQIYELMPLLLSNNLQYYHHHHRVQEELCVISVL
jgi:hypothetical protein